MNTVYVIKKNISESNEFQLNEIGDRPMKISKFNISSDGVLRARAIDKDLNITLDVLIDEGLFAVEGYYLINFYVNESSEKTGTGHEIKVFSTVKELLWIGGLMNGKIGLPLNFQQVKMEVMKTILVVKGYILDMPRWLLKSIELK